MIVLSVIELIEVDRPMTECDRPVIEFDRPLIELIEFDCPMTV